MYNSIKGYTPNSGITGVTTGHTAGEKRQESDTRGFNCVCNILFLLQNNRSMADVLVLNVFA